MRHHVEFRATGSLNLTHGLRVSGSGTPLQRRSFSGSPLTTAVSMTNCAARWTATVHILLALAGWPVTPHHLWPMVLWLLGSLLHAGSCGYAQVSSQQPEGQQPRQQQQQCKAPAQQPYARDGGRQFDVAWPTRAVVTSADRLSHSPGSRLES